jgi:GT2 family glycosyltransferase
VSPALPACPRFSVIVPTHGRPAELTRCLEALAHLDYPRDRFEVIVVDDGSGAPPEDVIERVRGRLPVTLVAHEHNRGPACARNTGAARAVGEFLAFTDDDCAPAADWLRVLASRFAEEPDALLGGRIVNGLTENPYAAASQLLIDYLYSYYYSVEPTAHRRAAREPPARFFTSNNLAMSAAGFHDTGAFDATFPLAAAEDRDFCDRWQQRGRLMRYVPRAVVYHFHDLSLRSFCRQHSHYGRGALSFHTLRARRAQGRIALEPLSFYLNLLRYPFTRPSDSLRARSRMTVLLAVSQGAYAAGFFAARVRRALRGKRRDGRGR